MKSTAVSMLLFVLWESAVGQAAPSTTWPTGSSSVPPPLWSLSEAERKETIATDNDILFASKN